ncbi:hypothetical protein SDC9_182812 [bioreactor metagenome]|uniref:Uncharacterized protein n=1 Tax=bioreactor metagenome TaxID=1076179 RepID=A0A645H8K0_9ZZZZ
MIAEHVGKQPAIIARVNPLDAIVGAHHGPGLDLLQHAFKPGKIQFKHCALIHNRVDGEAAILLIVEREVLHGGAYAKTLHPLDISGGKLAGDYGILAEIFKVAPAERTSLTIESGS